MERRGSSLNERRIKDRTPSNEGEQVNSISIDLDHSFDCEIKWEGFIVFSLICFESWEDDSRRFDSPRRKKYLVNNHVDRSVLYYRVQ